MYRIVGYLDKLAASGASDLTAAAKAFAIKHSGKGVVVIISDFLDKRGYEPALRYLLARNMDIYVIHVLSREEVEPELVGDLRLVDAEDDDIAEISVSAPLLRPVQGQPQRLRRRLQGVVHQARDHLYLHHQPEPVRQADPQLPAGAGAGPMNLRQAGSTPDRKSCRPWRLTSGLVDRSGCSRSVAAQTWPASPSVFVLGIVLPPNAVLGCFARRPLRALEDSRRILGLKSSANRSALFRLFLRYLWLGDWG